MRTYYIILLLCKQELLLPQPNKFLISLYIVQHAYICKNIVLPGQYLGHFGKELCDYGTKCDFIGHPGMICTIYVLGCIKISNLGKLLLLQVEKALRISVNIHRSVTKFADCLIDNHLCTKKGSRLFFREFSQTQGCYIFLFFNNINTTQ